MQRNHGDQARRALATTVALLGLIAILPAGAAGQAPPPGGYQENDFGGFRNILPPGENGFASFQDILQFLIAGTHPPHSDDQLGPYADLVYESPGLTEAEVDQFFKDASFGVPADDTEAEQYTPNCAVISAPSANSPHCDDVTIVRDSAFGVPHIYGADRSAAMFGSGYVAAEDRLFFMDVERHAGRAQLSSFLGGSNVGMDRSVWRTTPYTEAELQQQFDQADEVYGAEGALVQRDVQNYVDGINQYIAEARVGPPVVAPGSMIPGEYAPAALNRPLGPDPWQVTDVIATASLVAGIFGRGGGGELESALILQRAQERFGEAGGSAVWSDFRSANDAETPTTIDGPFPYGIPPANPEGVALPDPGTIQPEPIVVPDGAAAPAPARRPLFKGLGSLEGASNALLVSARESASGHPIAVMGPQVSYFAPQILMEQDIHAPTTAEGPALDARGAGFAGVSLYVLLGRGQDYAWSATSAGQDIIDTYALKLCEPDGGTPTLESDHYLYDGECLPFEVLERTNSWAPNPIDPTPAGTETLGALRTQLGIVSHRAMLDGEPVAYTQLRSTYFHDADSAIGFARFNSPDEIQGPEDYQQAANLIDYTFNWFYADDEHIAYFNSGDNPVRPPNVDPSLPVLGEPQYVWQGFDPEAHTSEQAPFEEHPQAIDPTRGYLSNWNNKQAPQYSGADDNWSFTSVHRVDSLDQRIAAEIAGDGTMTRAELVDAMEDAGTVDLRGSRVLGRALEVIRSGKRIKDRKVRKAVKTLGAWRRRGAHRRDADRTGSYDSANAIRLMDAWWPRLVKAQFRPVLGGPLFQEVQEMIGLDNEANPGGSAYGSGWYGYVEKDLRRVLRAPVTDPYSRRYCGGGRLAACRKALTSSLRKALRHRSNEELYPRGPCDLGGPQICHDAVRHTATGGISQPPIHWINRPTFQQVVEVQGHR
jgi:acyl-homoserine lactone acylase PvdQ